MSRAKIYTKENLPKEQPLVARNKNLAGKRIGKLTVLYKCEPPVKRKNTATFWLCKCDCGNYVAVDVAHLNGKTMKTNSCGCLHS